MALWPWFGAAPVCRWWTCFAGCRARAAEGASFLIVRAATPAPRPNSRRPTRTTARISTHLGTRTRSSSCPLPGPRAVESPAPVEPESREPFRPGGREPRRPGVRSPRPPGRPSLDSEVGQGGACGPPLIAMMLRVSLRSTAGSSGECPDLFRTGAGDLGEPRRRRCWYLHHPTRVFSIRRASGAPLWRRAQPEGIRTERATSPASSARYASFTSPRG